jgi:hypothetical protein
VTDELIRLAVVAGACPASLVAVQVVHRILLWIGRRFRVAKS